MASIFRRSRKKGTPYTIQYRDHEGNRQTVKGFTDRGLTEQLAAKLEMEARLRATGLVDPEQERIAEREQTELTELIEQFKQSLGEKSSQYVLHTISRLKKIVDGCGFSTLSDLRWLIPESVSHEATKENPISHEHFHNMLSCGSSLFAVQKYSRPRRF